MKKKYKILLLLIAFLIFVTLGVSYAYYTSKTKTNGEGSKIEEQTAQVGNATIHVIGNLDDGTHEAEENILPGHISVSKVTVYATREDTPNDFSIRYNLIWKGTNSLTSDLKFKVYKTTNADAKIKVNCKEISEIVSSQVRLSEECSLSSDDIDLTDIYDEGTIPTSQTAEDEIIKLTPNKIESIMATEDGDPVYYHVVVEYENKNENQNQDMSTDNTTKGINGTVKVEVVDTPSQTLKYPYHNVETVLGTLKVYDDEPNFLQSVLIADEGYYCHYKGNIIETNSDDYVWGEEKCNDEIIKYTYIDYTGVYTTSYFTTFNNKEITGVATWDAENSKCMYNGIDVKDWLGNTIEIKSSCGEVICGEHGCTGGIDIIEEGGTWEKITKNLGATGIYKDQDEDGITYYYRGYVGDNYVEFANFYWQIIRINGNGSLRLIYHSKAKDDYGNDIALKPYYPSMKDHSIGISKFNENNNDEAYVGFMYTVGSTHGTGQKSTILKVLEKWYRKNLTNVKTDDEGNMIDINGNQTMTPIIDITKTDYDTYIEKDSGFCGDRTYYLDSYGDTVYGGYARLSPESGNERKPTFKCPDNRDLYTVYNSSKGNQSLTYPIGLVTVDELYFSGLHAYKVPEGGYLESRDEFWTMSPEYYYHNAAYVFGLNYEPYGLSTYDQYCVIPVINLNTDNLIITGTGTINDPYVIK
ncbi:MAG: hypothetical protein E7163_01355 [Firmicutes bacterium]|nr:hypothetical protein [Bacillota bacterium]